MTLLPHSGRVLLVRSDGLGDAVLGTSLLAGLRAGRPDCHVTLAVREGLRPFFADCPWVDSLIGFQAPSGGMDVYQLSAVNVANVRAIQSLPAPLDQPFDVVVDMHPNNNAISGSMALTALAPARHRLGAPMWDAASKHIMEAVYDNVLDLSPRHEVHRYQALSHHLGGAPEVPSLWNQENHRQTALKVLGEGESWLETPRVFIHVGGSFNSKRWPVDRFAALTRRIVDHDCDVVVVGGPGEVEDVRRVAAAGRGRALPLVGTLSPHQLASIMTNGVFVGNDSGPLHLAAVSGLPVVQISMHPRSGNSSVPFAVERFGPWGVPFAVAQPNAFLEGCGPVCRGVPGTGEAHCITQVSVDDVWNALNELVTFDTPSRGDAAPALAGSPR